MEEIKHSFNSDPSQPLCGLPYVIPTILGLWCWQPRFLGRKLGCWSAPWGVAAVTNYPTWWLKTMQMYRLEVLEIRRLKWVSWDWYEGADRAGSLCGLGDDRLLVLSSFWKLPSFLAPGPASHDLFPPWCCCHMTLVHLFCSPSLFPFM